MTAPNPITDAIALLRDMGAPLEHPRVRSAIASALEELDERTRVDGPHDWSGTFRDAPWCSKCGAVRKPGDSSDRGCPGKPPTHSPPPSREGEALPPRPVTTEDAKAAWDWLADQTTKMAELKRRAEAAEERAAKEREAANEWLAALHDTKKELEAARARVVSPETIAALQEYAVARGVHAAHIADEDADDKGAERELAHRHFARLAERDLWHLIDENAKPTPSAPTPAVVDDWGIWCERDGEPGFWRQESMRNPVPLRTTKLEAERRARNLNDGQLERTDSRGWHYEARPHGEESPPRDSGGEAAGLPSELTCHDPGPPNQPASWCAVCGSFSSFGSPWQLPKYSARYIARRERENHVERKDPSETAEAPPSVTASSGPGGVGQGVRGDAPGSVEPGGMGGPGGVAPPGLTPEEAERWEDFHGPGGTVEGARRLFEIVTDGGNWNALLQQTHDRYIKAYRFAHSAGRTERGREVAERARNATRKAQFVAAQLGGMFGYDEAAGLARELEALAQELESGNG